jgi:glutathione-regulated potassium-efflux system ancillary protein KefG
LPPLLKLWIDEVFDMRWISENETNILAGKDAIIITSVGGRENNYTQEGKYGTEVEELLSGSKYLYMSIISISKKYRSFITLIILTTELDLLCEELSEILKIE